MRTTAINYYYSSTVDIICFRLLQLSGFLLIQRIHRSARQKIIEAVEYILFIHMFSEFQHKIKQY